MPVLGSSTGVEVEPMYGVRSEQPIVFALNGCPKLRRHTMAPVVALTP